MLTSKMANSEVPDEMQKSGYALFARINQMSVKETV